MKRFGIIPARMAASRFPGKPLASICGMTMIEHVYHRARLHDEWEALVLATCDVEIAEYAEARGIPFVMTGNHHTRALDRVAEATARLGVEVAADDIIVCVQGDEPLMRPDMMTAVAGPLVEDPRKACTVLAMHIVDEEIWMNPDTVKVIHNDSGEVLYTSRSPVPHAKAGFSPELMARRIYGILAFRWQYLQAFTAHPETRLEQVEACDSNRILDMDFAQHIAPYPAIESFSVDSPSDVDLVERHMEADALWATYRSEAGQP
jgi:3-deoxy-manno-octulosonate cytidylyltransferase (CMP-KDO synthetase)